MTNKDKRELISEVIFSICMIIPTIAVMTFLGIIWLFDYCITKIADWVLPIK